MFPDWLQIKGLEEAITTFVEWLVDNGGWIFDAATTWLLQWVLLPIEQTLVAAPWWFVILVIAGLGFHASRSIRLTAGLAASMFLIGALGFWELAMQTMALMVVATSLSVIIGVPIGIGLSRSPIARQIMAPVLDAMQTVPPFVYLIPAVMLLGLGKVPAIIATLIYATPPVIRLTDLGLRQVDGSVAEAADAFGASRWQKLWQVELPLALPSIMAGINQTTMMALSMVVLGSMIGARGLGEEVLRGLQSQNVGRGVAVGIAIVALAIVLDRLTQAYGRRVDPARSGRSQAAELNDHPAPAKEAAGATSA